MRVKLLILTGLTASSFTACQTAKVDDTDLDGPVFAKKETQVKIGTDSGELNIHDLGKIAKTVRKYKALGQGDQEVIRKIAQLKLDGYTAIEMQRLTPKYEPRKAAVVKAAEQRKVSVRTAAKPPAKIKEEVAAIESETEKQLESIQREWRQEALAAVSQRYGTDFAVPVKNDEGLPVVAFASLKDEAIQVSSNSYVLNQPPPTTSLAKVEHEGSQYALLQN